MGNFRRICLCVVLIVNSVIGLYEDQIGKFDWNQKYIGKHQYSEFDISSSVKKIIVTTHENVLASLNLKSGEILWRHVFTQDDSGNIQFLHVGSKIITVHGINPYTVRGWNTETGHLLFEWSTGADTVDAVKWLIVGKNIVKISVSDSDYTVYNLETGQKFRQETISSQFQNSEGCITSGLYYACLGDGKLYFAKFNEEFKDINLQTRDISNVRNGVLKLEQIGSDSPAVIIASNDEKYLINLLTNKPPVLLPQGGSKHHFVAAVDENYYLFSCSIEDEVLNVVGTDLTSLQPVPQLINKVDLPKSLTNLESGSVMCHQRKDNVITCRLLVSGTDDSLSLIQHPGQILWTREESLASIVTVDMLDLPVSDTDAAIEKEFNNKEAGVFGMFFRRLLSQAYQVQSLVLTVLGMSGPPSSRETEGLIRDEFGLHKLIIAATAPGKIFGIDNLTGKIIWSFTLDNVQPFKEQTTKNKLYYPMFLLRSTRHYPYPALLGLLVKDDAGYCSLIVLNPITGDITTNNKLGYKIKQVTALHQLDEEFVRGLIILDTQNQVHVYPPSSSKLAASLADITFMYVADASAGTVEGFTLSFSTSSGLVATNTWNMNFGQNGDRIVSVVGKNPNERVHSQGRVLSDRSVLYKYVNPNLVAVVTEGPHPSHKNVVSIYLIDVVSGTIVYSIMNRRAKEPYHIVHSENWLLYTYFSDKYRRTELTTIEMYEGKTQSNATTFSSVTFSSFQPLVEKQSYIFPANVLALKETITEKGITSKHILVALSNGGILELPWMLIDPRRPIQVTQEMREEGVLPYMPELPIPLEAVINYNQSLVNIRDIHTSPSDLESTCLVFAYGLDIFYTRVAPSKTFDLLKDDFDYFLITTVLVALAAASYLTRRLSSRKALKQAWK